MKINFNSLINGIDDKPLADANGENLTLASVAVECLLFPRKEMEQELKIKCYVLFKKIKNRNKDGKVNIDLKDAELILKSISDFKGPEGEVLGPLILGRCKDIIEGSE